MKLDPFFVPAPRLVSDNRFLGARVNTSQLLTSDGGVFTISSSTLSAIDHKWWWWLRLLPLQDVSDYFYNFLMGGIPTAVTLISTLAQYFFFSLHVLSPLFFH